MRIHTIEHVPFEGPSAIAGYIYGKGYGLTRSRIFAGARLPGLSRVDLLVVLGGPMSVHDVDEHPWLKREKEYLGQAIERGVSILGICLGAQLLSQALGGQVTRNPAREVGWHEVRLEAPADRHRAFEGFPERFTAFHWHADTFSIPDGASRLALSDACANQAFAMDAKWVGLQFHLETTPGSMELLIENCPGDLEPGPHVQDAATMRQGAGHVDGILKLMGILLTNMTKEM
jgi:GMP synthase-like glutamine amidotransferase